jgi:hypothetical protein
MTTPAVATRQPTLRRRQQRSLDAGNQSDSFKAQVFLGVACLWPILFVLFLSGGQGPSQESLRHGLKLTEQSVRNALDRVDIMGYGPTHPRVAVVIVGENKNLIQQSVKSVFRYVQKAVDAGFVQRSASYLSFAMFHLSCMCSRTELERIFCICAVVEGHAEDVSFEEELKKIASGAQPHWHGLKPDWHKPNHPEDQSNEPHGQKIHVLFNKVSQGVASSRADAVEFLQILSRNHVEAGLKSPQEDLILLLLESGAELDSIKWLTQVTSALIVPPPLLGKKDDANVAMKLANAISFNTEGGGKRTSIDDALFPVVTEARAVDVNLSNGMDYPTPAWNGVALAMRLDTYVNLPMQDATLQEAWHANLDLSLNLWLCADGIDMLQGLTASGSNEAHPTISMAPTVAARFAAVWMDDAQERELFSVIAAKTRDLTRLEWETYLSQARRSPTIQATGGMQRKCRSFTWYSEQIVGKEAGSKSKPEHKANDGAVTSDEKLKDPEVQEKISKKKKKRSLPVPKSEKTTTGDGGADNLAKNEVPERRNLKMPSQPLDPARLEIIKKAQPVDLKKVDVAGDHSQDPHKGARDANGNFGYVHDPTALRMNPPTYHFENLQRACSRHDDDYKMLTEKVFVDLAAHEEAEKSGRKRDKIFCLVYTTEKGHTKIPFIRETWG